MSKIMLEVKLCTDGDFSPKDCKLVECLPGSDNEYVGVIKCSFDIADEYRLENVLSQILCSIHVSYTHYYIMRYLYDFFNDAIKAAHDEREEYYHTVNGGNYDGSYIKWCKIDVETDTKEKSADGLAHLETLAELRDYFQHMIENEKSPWLDVDQAKKDLAAIEYAISCIDRRDNR